MWKKSRAAHGEERCEKESEEIEIASVSRRSFFFWLLPCLSCVLFYACVYMQHISTHRVELDGLFFILHVCLFLSAFSMVSCWIQAHTA